MRTKDVTKAAALYMLKNGLASCKEVAELSGRSQATHSHLGRESWCTGSRKTISQECLDPLNGRAVDRWVRGPQLRARDLLRKQLVPDVARRGRESDAARLAPSRFGRSRSYRRSSGDRTPSWPQRSRRSSVVRIDGFFPFTSFQSFTGPSFSFGSSSVISRRGHYLSLSPARLRPPGNAQRLSRRRRTSSTRPFFAATSFEDLAIFLQNRFYNPASVYRGVPPAVKSIVPL